MMYDLHSELLMTSQIEMKRASLISLEGGLVQMQELETLLTFKEAMKYLRVSRSTLLRLMTSGQLIGHKLGGTWRFYASDLQSAVQQKAS